MLTAYARLWCATMAVHHIMTPTLVPHPHWDKVHAVLLAVTFAKPTRFTLSCAISARLAMYIVQAPFIWSMCIWVLQIDLVLLGALILCRSDVVVPSCSGLIRTITSLLYMGAGFWKLNSSFLDPTVSCATVFAASLATRLPEQLTPSWLIGPALALSPHLTVLFEFAPGLLLLLPSRAAQRLGVVLVVVLHYAIAMTPFPNAIPQFGLHMITRMFFVLPEAFTAALAEACSVPSGTGGTFGRVAAAAFVAYTASCTDTPGWRCDWGLPAVAALCVVATRACAIDLTLGSPPDRRAPTAQDPKPKAHQRSWLTRLGAACALLLTLSYELAFYPLGLMDISGCSPFVMLSKPTSNHLLLPTALLQRSEALAAHDKFGGGVVRVTHTTSDFLNALYPSNATGALPARARAMLRESGHVGQQFSPTARRMLGPRIRSFMPRWRPGEGVPFTAYTLPALELRRMLEEARGENESFSLEYERLPGLSGDERWRQTAVASQVRIEEDGHGRRSCESRPSIDGAWSGCAADELANLPPPKGPLMKLMLFHPYPIIPGLTELPCYS